jgi:hypothetical protein
MRTVLAPRWGRSPDRAALLALYAEADALLEGLVCACSTPGADGARDARCCQFGITGREPYPTAVELEEVFHAMRASSVSPREARRLPLADQRPCPLLSDDGRCRIYASRPFGCRTFFCGQKLPRVAVSAIGRRISDLSARFAPRDPGPRPLTRCLAGRLR